MIVITSNGDQPPNYIYKHIERETPDKKKIVCIKKATKLCDAFTNEKEH